MDPSDTVAVVAGKFTARAIRFMGAGLGSNLPGKLARRFAPTVLTKLSAQAKSGVIAVTGTNGKSTTSGLLSSILRAAGLELVHNKQGANLVAGITASLVESASWSGKLSADYCLFETDEAALPLIAREVKLSQVVVTNLFRDQLDRFGELDTTAKLIARGILENKSQAILNADDPNVSQLVPECSRIFFGIESVKNPTEKQTTAVDGMGPQSMELSYCAQCGAETAYSLVFYGQLGHWSCANCGHKRPVPRVKASDVEVGPTGSTFVLTIDERKGDAVVPLPGMFNVYNALAAAASAASIGVTIETIRQGLKNYQTLFGRSERVTISGKNVLIQLIKNPAGASQAIAAVAADPDARILIAINDNYADGRDISWLWDADFEQLASHSKKLIVSGQRAEDMAVRMKYAGVAQENIHTESKLDKALDQALDMVPAHETLWILPTYTCLLEMQKILKARGVSLSGT
ncbi:MAG TPA: MurT ligase domain-containing protein [Drouetiella sp.]|jgi:lipid II isoglutaminyl synthase (glutamine-hydrolysing)